jgi:hypothetical protein
MDSARDSGERGGGAGERERCWERPSMVRLSWGGQATVDGVAIEADEDEAETEADETMASMGAGLAVDVRAAGSAESESSANATTAGSLRRRDIGRGREPAVSSVEWTVAGALWRWITGESREGLKLPV